MQGLLSRSLAPRSSSSANKTSACYRCPCCQCGSCRRGGIRKRTLLAAVCAAVVVVFLVGSWATSLVPAGYKESQCMVEAQGLRDMYDLLERFAGAMAAENVTWWADNGLLLGAVRDHAIIPWDVDLDVSILQRDLWRLKRMQRTGAWARLGMATATDQTIVLAKHEALAKDRAQLELLPAKVEVFSYAVKPNNELAREDVYASEVAALGGRDVGLSFTERFVTAFAKWWSPPVPLSEIFPLGAVDVVVPASLRQPPAAKNGAAAEEGAAAALPDRMTLPAPLRSEAQLVRLYGSTWNRQIKWKVKCYL